MRKNNVDEINLTIDNVDFWSPHSGNKGGMRVYWSSSIGFGQLDIVKVSGNDESDVEGETDEELKLVAYTEHMDTDTDRAFTKKILSLLSDFLTIGE